MEKPLKTSNFVILKKYAEFNYFLRNLTVIQGIFTVKFQVVIHLRRKSNHSGENLVIIINELLYFSVFFSNDNGRDTRLVAKSTEF